MPCTNHRETNGLSLPCRVISHSFHQFQSSTFLVNILLACGSSYQGPILGRTRWSQDHVSVLPLAAQVSHITHHIALTCPPLIFADTPEGSPSKLHPVESWTTQSPVGEEATVKYDVFLRDCQFTAMASTKSPSCRQVEFMNG
jgi:hypothetical protein